MPPPVEHGMQRWLLPHTAATNQPREKEEEIRWPVVNYTHKRAQVTPETHNNTKLSRNRGQPPATSLTKNKRRARLEAGRSLNSINPIVKIFNYSYIYKCEKENKPYSPTHARCRESNPKSCHFCDLYVAISKKTFSDLKLFTCSRTCHFKFTNFLAFCITKLHL
jgi:hypothetical protein